MIHKRCLVHSCSIHAILDSSIDAIVHSTVNAPLRRSLLRATKCRLGHFDARRRSVALASNQRLRRRFVRAQLIVQFAHTRKLNSQRESNAARRHQQFKSFNGLRLQLRLHPEYERTARHCTQRTARPHPVRLFTRNDRGRPLHAADRCRMRLFR